MKERVDTVAQKTFAGNVFTRAWNEFKHMSLIGKVSVVLTFPIAAVILLAKNAFKHEEVKQATLEQLPPLSPQDQRDKKILDSFKPMLKELNEEGKKEFKEKLKQALVAADSRHPSEKYVCFQTAFPFQQGLTIAHGVVFGQWNKTAGEEAKTAFFEAFNIVNVPGQEHLFFTCCKKSMDAMPKQKIEKPQLEQPRKSSSPVPPQGTSRRTEPKSSYSERRSNEN